MPPSRPPRSRRSAYHANVPATNKKVIKDPPKKRTPAYPNRTVNMRPALASSISSRQRIIFWTVFSLNVRIALSSVPWNFFVRKERISDISTIVNGAGGAVRAEHERDIDKCCIPCYLLDQLLNNF